MSSRRSDWSPPAPRRLAADGARAAGELGAMGATLPYLRRAPKGDGHPVLVLPGLAASDRSTQPLRWFLRDRGYHVHGWKLGANVGPTTQILSGLRSRMKALGDQHGQPVSLIGWSMGGIYAREIASSTPRAVRDVITLGSPFRMSGRGGQPSCPVTAVYTKADGVVDWRTCVEDPGPRRESVQVRGSHTGMGHNPAVLLVIADRLAQPEGTWAPFRPTTTWRRLGGVGTDAATGAG